jgi:hypothetical protein
LTLTGPLPTFELGDSPAEMPLQSTVLLLAGGLLMLACQ